MARLRDEGVKGGVESTHIMDDSVLNYGASIEIQTLNRDNRAPDLITDEAFKAKLIKELMGLI